MDVRSTDYTPLFIDLIDNVNQLNAISETRTVDNVSGYTTGQLEDAIIDVKTMDQLRETLRDRYENPTEGSLNEYFANY